MKIYVIDEDLLNFQYPKNKLIPTQMRWANSSRWSIRNRWKWNVRSKSKEPQSHRKYQLKWKTAFAMEMCFTLTHNIKLCKTKETGYVHDFRVIRCSYKIWLTHKIAVEPRTRIENQLRQKKSSCVLCLDSVGAVVCGCLARHWCGTASQSPTKLNLIIVYNARGAALEVVQHTYDLSITIVRL